MNLPFWRPWRRLFPTELASGSSGGWLALFPSPIATDGGELWAQLAQATDPRSERPRARRDVAAERLPGDAGAILSDPERGVYAHLANEDLFLWERMDGTRTQVDLVVDYCMRYKALAPARVAALVESLRAQGLLEEPPDELYPRLQARVVGATPMGRVNQITQTFLAREFAISGIDAAIGWIYRSAGWLLYTWPAQVLLWLIALAGLGAFLLLLHGGQFSALGEGTLVAGALLLFVFQIIALFLHELAHALTVKAYGRRVRRAGLLLLYGMPGAFVDTTDIWPAGKRAQLAVTWAGPFANLVLGGIAALLIVTNRGGEFAPLAFQFAVSQYLLVAFNLTPFIRLDGYYLLADWLGIANLRQRALGFLRNGLPHRARQAWAAGRLMPALTRQEQILVAFGAISALWVVNLFALAVITAPVRLVGTLERLVLSGAGGRSPLGVFFALTGVLLTTLLLIRSVAAGRRWLGTMARALQRFAPWNTAMAFAALALLVAAVPDLLAPWSPGAAMVYAHAIALAAAGLAALYALWLSGELRGAWLRLPVRGLLISALALLGVAAAGALGALAPTTSVWLPSALPLLRLLALLPALLASGLVFTTLLRLWRAALGWSILLGGSAVGLFALAALPLAPGAFPTLAAHTLLAAALMVHWELAHRPLAVARAPIELAGTDPAGLLATAVAAVAGELAQALGEIAGRPALLRLAAAFNRRAAGADWPLWLTMEGRLGDRCAGSVEQRASIYRAALAGLHEQIAAALGPAVARDAQAQALAELPLPARAAFQRWILAGADDPGPHAAAVDDDRVRLRLAGRRLAEALVIGCARVYGWRLTEVALGGFNRTAAVAGWPLYLRGNGRLADDLQGDLLAIAQVYTEALQDLLGRVAAIAGAAFVERGVVQVYDSLPWEAREVAATLVFGRLSWARRLTRPGDGDPRLAFLRSVPLLSWLAPEELADLATQVRPRRVRAGRMVVARDAYLDHALIVRQGVVQAVAVVGEARRTVERIDAGGLIGVRSILQGQPVPYEYLAQSEVELWLLPRAVVERRLGPLLQLQDALDEERATAAVLARIPLFAALDAGQRVALARTFAPLRLPPGSVVVEEGAASQGFFIVRAGELEVLVRGAAGDEHRLSTLGPGEFFGEAALLNRSPVTATVRARTEVELLRLAPEAFYELLAPRLDAPLAQIHSRRTKERARLVQVTSFEGGRADG